MNFLEAHEILATFPGGEPFSLLLGMSGSGDKLLLYLHAAAAKLGRQAQVRTLSFGTLSQAILQPPVKGEREVFLLLPWDFVTEADWRSGFPPDPPQWDDVMRRSEVTTQRMAQRDGARFLYIAAPILPLFADSAINSSLTSHLCMLATSLGARVLPVDFFSLSSYLYSGCPVAGQQLGRVAELVIDAAMALPPSTCKVLVTDLDQTLWAGVIGDDGMEGIHFGPEGRGFRHFLYQTLLAKLRREGVLLAGVSRNQPEIAMEPLRGGRMALGEEDFICVLCSYNAKSSQVRQIAEQLNLGLDSFVFVDDSPVEVAEVSNQLPLVHCVQFPERDDELPALFSRLTQLFRRSGVTAEDRERTEMYRRRLHGLPPSSTAGGDLTSFLRDLQMKLVVHDRSLGNHDRALQLINKTNQFNLNGRRLSEQELTAALRNGARLYTATLMDRNGSHGEILACLVSPEGVITSLAMSCRVFQRRVEYAFLVWLAAQASVPKELHFTPTARNLPVQEFLCDPAFGHGNDAVRFDAACFAAAHDADLQLFTVGTTS